MTGIHAQHWERLFWNLPLWRWKRRYKNNAKHHFCVEFRVKYFYGSIFGDSRTHGFSITFIIIKRSAPKLTFPDYFSIYSASYFAQLACTRLNSLSMIYTRLHLTHTSCFVFRYVIVSFFHTTIYQSKPNPVRLNRGPEKQHPNSGDRSFPNDIKCTHVGIVFRIVDTRYTSNDIFYNAARVHKKLKRRGCVKWRPFWKCRARKEPV